MKNLSLLALLSCTISRCAASDMPSVDLGYEIHQGSLNETGDYYLFSNVPYAEQPIGDLRFQKPVAISSSSSEVNNGSTTGVMCMQGYPPWVVDLSAASAGISSDLMTSILYNTEGQTESCLLLDVYVPTATFDNETDEKVPVLLYIHGGGFTYGSKSSPGDPSTLFSRSLANGGSGAIVIMMNYRLGMFGWLVGGGVTPNLGLYDQLAALEWIQEYISRFGGDPDQVTVMGDSAGGASILHHLTGNGGASQAPFQYAVPQSPAFQFSLDYDNTYELTLNGTLAQLEAITGEDSASLASYASNYTALVDLLESYDEANITEVLKAINWAIVQQADTGEFMYGVVVSGDYVTDLPQVLLAQGKFDSSVKVMNSHMSNESVPFVPTTIATDDDFRTYLEEALGSTVNSTTLDTIVTDLYPAVFDGTYPWYSHFGRAVQLTSEFFFACSTNFLSKALNGAARNYIFAYPPGYHFEDVNYIFFNGDTSTLVDGYPLNVTLATTLQDYLMRFVLNGGDPNGDALPVAFPEYGSEGSALWFEETEILVQTDDMMTSRCEWLQQAMVDGLVTHS